jgi:RNA-directed DNA polymerase
MSGDVHVRFCESAGVRLPRATLLVLVFQEEGDARRVEAVLGRRFAKYGLTLHPDKTRLVRFERPRRGSGQQGPKPGTFDLLGFTFYWGRTLRGGWAVKTRTGADRLRRAVSAIAVWCRRNRHLPVPQQHATLVRKVRGHYQYYGRPGNYDALVRFVRLVTKIWRKWLSRRSWKSRLSWPKFNRLLSRHPLPRPRIMSASIARESIR